MPKLQLADHCDCESFENGIDKILKNSTPQDVGVATIIKWEIKYTSGVDKIFRIYAIQEWDYLILLPINSFILFT